MALVAYDNSDCSDSEEDDWKESKLSVEAKSKLRSEIVLEKAEIVQNSPVQPTSCDRSLFASLPPPRSLSSQITVSETDDDLSPVPNQKDSCKWAQTKDNKPVRIAIPSLSELAEDDQPSMKKPRMSTGKGLLSALPPPKHSTVKVANRPLIPYSVKPKGQPPKVLPQKSSTKQLKQNLAASSKHSNDSDDDDDDLGETLDFFSLESVGKMPDAPCSSVDGFTEPSTSNAKILESAYNPVTADATGNYNCEGHDNPNHESDSSHLEASSSTGSISSDLSTMMCDEGFLRLGGTKKRGQQDIQFIDVAQADQLPSREEWMRKALMEKTGYRPSRKKGFMPTSQQRRKHQITYLAFQAKEREMELQEQWAQNRFTRHQTQSKYGF